jgi:hypothetical protein
MYRRSSTIVGQASDNYDVRDFRAPDARNPIAAEISGYKSEVVKLDLSMFG